MGRQDRLRGPDIRHGGAKPGDGREVLCRPLRLGPPHLPQGRRVLRLLLRRNYSSV